MMSQATQVGAKAVLLFWHPDDHATAKEQESCAFPVEVPHVPSQIVSTNVARDLLSKLQGVPAPEMWMTQSLAFCCLGPSKVIASPSGLHVKLVLNNQLKRRKMYNVIATVYGYREPDEHVYIGASRTSTLSSDARLSTAMLLNAAECLSDSMRAPILWQPQRTIKFISWSGLEYNSLGLLRYIQSQKNLMLQKGVMYFDLDQTVLGNHTLRVIATPALRTMAIEAVKKVHDPTKHGLNIKKTWSEKRITHYADIASSYPMLNLLGLATVKYQYSSHDPNNSRNTMAEMTMEEGRHHYRYHLATGRLTLYSLLLIADNKLQSSHNVMEYGRYLYKRGRNLVTYCKSINLIASSTELKKLLESLTISARALLMTSQHFTSQGMSDSTSSYRVRRRVIMFDKSLLVELPHYLKRSYHILMSPEQSKDMFQWAKSTIKAAVTSPYFTHTVYSVIQTLINSLDSAMQCLQFENAS